MIYIRTDMNEKIATGHVMRCLSIADAAKRIGEQATFLLADEQAQSLIAERGHRSIVLHSRWDDLEAELERMAELIRAEGVKSLLVDSYSVTSRYLAELKKLTRVMYMDDGNAVCHPVDAILCYAGYYGKYHEPREGYLLGTDYVPLREEYCGCPPKKISPEVKKLLVMSGGSDPHDMIGRLLAEMDRGLYEAIYAVCGIYHQRYEELARRYQDDPAVQVLRDVRDLKKYITEADIAISAAGSTLYELAAVGTPTVCYTIADNQIDNALWWQENGFFEYAGDARGEDVIPRILERVKTLSEAYEERQKKSAGIQRCVDGKGAERIARGLIELQK